MNHLPVPAHSPTWLHRAWAGLLLGVGLVATGPLWACTTGAWGVGLAGGAGGAQSAIGGVVVGQPYGGGGTTALRYTGQCGLRASSAGQYVQDGTPEAEATYVARFYVHVNMTTGTPVVFRALEGAPGSSTPIVSIQYNRSSQRFEAVNRLGSVSTIGATNSAVNNNFYHVHLDWTRATGALGVTIQGAGANSPNATASLSGFGSTSSASAGPDFIQLGWVAGTAAGAVNIDSFEARRTGPIPRLCRGDANNSGSLSVGDRGAVTTELLNQAPSAGPSDCNENGSVSVGDRGCITALLLAGVNACDGSF